METSTGRAVMRQRRAEKADSRSHFLWLLSDQKAVSADGSPGLLSLEISSTEGDKERTRVLTKSADTAKLGRPVTMLWDRNNSKQSWQTTASFKQCNSIKDK